MSYKKGDGTFRKFTGKRLLAEVRGGDYAHAGSEEAIIQTFAVFSKNPHRTILDVGCGQGGTANFVQENGWGRVVGFDIEEASIAYAKERYKTVQFWVGDAADEQQLIGMFGDQKFDLIYIFHALCVFPKQFETLKALRRLAHDQTQLVIVEYEDLTSGNNPLNKTEEAESYFNVMSRVQFKIMLKKTGWDIDEGGFVDLSENMRRWYQDFLNALEQKKKKIISHFGEGYFDKAKERYGGIMDAINQGVLGGCILYAHVGGK